MKNTKLHFLKTNNLVFTALVFWNNIAFVVLEYVRLVHDKLPLFFFK